MTRRHTRVDFGAEIEIAVDGGLQRGMAENISLGGLFVSTDPAPPVGTKVTLVISLPDVLEVCRIPSIVRWSKVDQGVGLQFERLRPIEVWAVNKLVRTLSQSE
jgi:Tfp pilus assembly protein PilZ